jgi:adiponectin receptor
MFVLSPLATKLGYKSAILPLFLLFAASGIFPLGHGVVLYGWERLDELVGLKYVLLHGAIYLASLGPFKVRTPNSISSLLH